MSSTQQKSKTYNIKKCKKLEAKKRKLEAFLELVRKDEETSLLQKKKSGGSFEENYKALKNELKKYQKKAVTEPSFYLLDEGVKAQAKLPLNNNYPKCSAPLFVEDVRNLLVKSVLGNLSPFPLRWAKLEHVQSISGTVLFVIEGLSVEDIIETHNQLIYSENSGIFPYIVEIVSSDMAFATELSTLHLATDFYNYAKENYADLFPIDKSAILKSESSRQINGGTLSKLHLLLNPIQLVMENYPMPVCVFGQSKTGSYAFSKDSYSPVTINSPMFALDCEMCQTISGNHEVTRIAVVNEQLETVYHTLVKPHGKIVDYMTRYSGVTKEMMKGVKTTLSDVHEELRKILPGDAILCGQSLNCDLHALKMIHPYVIDTSVIFNHYGIRQKKTSLKQLARIHLKEAIQDGKKGHNPIEDSIATMKLVQLKLKKSLEYGDAVFHSDETDRCFDSEDKSDSLVATKSPKFSDFIKLNSNSDEDYGFFSRISRLSKTVCLIGNEESLSNYCIGDNTVTQIKKSDLSSIALATSDNSKDFDLIISNFAVNESSSIIELNTEIKQTYNNISKKTLFIVLLSGIDKFRGGNFKRSLCMAVLK